VPRFGIGFGNPKSESEFDEILVLRFKDTNLKSTLDSINATQFLGFVKQRRNKERRQNVPKHVKDSNYSDNKLVLDALCSL